MRKGSECEIDKNIKTFYRSISFIDISSISFIRGNSVQYYFFIQNFKILYFSNKFLRIRKLEVRETCGNRNEEVFLHNNP